MKFLLLLALSFLTFAPAAKAQALDPQAAILKAQIEGFIDAQKATAQKHGCILATNGEITVEKADTYYAFTLPHITFTDAKGVRSEIGMVAINATPDGADSWKISLALPTPINSFNASGKQVVRTDMGAQQISGVWNTKLGHFTLVNGSVMKVQVNDLVKQNTINIANISISSALSELQPSVWSGKANATLGSVSVYNADTNFTATIPKIAMTTNLSDKSSATPLTKEQIMARLQDRQGVDGYHIFAALLGAPNQVQAIITGLDGVSTQLQQAMLTAKPEQRQDFLTSILAVGALSGIGRPVPNDASSKSYDVVFGPSGSMTINGTDFGAMLAQQKQMKK